MPHYVIATGLSRAAYCRAESYLTESKGRGFSVYFPKEQVLIVHAGRKEIVDNPFIPGYAFVEEDDRDPAMIRNCPGVNGIAYGATWYQRMRVDEFVAALKAEEAAGFIGGQLDPQVVTKYKPGEIVRVREGPFTLFNGVFECERSARVQVMVSIFGRPTRVELDYDQIEAV